MTRLHARRTHRSGSAPWPARVAAVLGAGALVGALVGGLAAAPAAADGYQSITGAGSTWSQVAIDAWRADVRGNGLVVNYSGTGSTDGRIQYMQDQTDFSVSEIPFENPPEPGQQAEIPNRPYAYLPIVAGGTSFMYHVTVRGQLVRDLKLSGDTLVKIYTGKITSWDDPQITSDYGKKLPRVRIIPVVRPDGSGASAQLTKWFLDQYRGTWCPFAHDKLRQPANQCTYTSFYPVSGNAKGVVGSNGTANYVSASYAEGAIGYVEYAYAKNLDYPVVSVLNKAGYYAQPSASNVAVALTKAQIKPDLTQDLRKVYVNPDPRTYPLSSYSYMIVPTSTAKPFTEAKGRSLSTFINYFLCAGQQKAAILGYSPLPENLVLEGFKQVAKIPGGVSSPSIKSCKNPALRILTTAPQPNPCDKRGAPATCGGAASTGSSSGGSSGGTSGSGGGASGSGGSGGTSTNGSGGGATGDPGGAGGAPGTTVVDPVTGEVTVVPDGSTTGGQEAVALAFAQPMDVAPGRSGTTTWVYFLVGLALLGVVVAPPVVVALFPSRRTGPAGNAHWGNS